MFHNPLSALSVTVWSESITISVTDEVGTKKRRSSTALNPTIAAPTLAMGTWKS